MNISTFLIPSRINVANKKHYLGFTTACLRKTSRAGSPAEALCPHKQGGKSPDCSFSFPREVLTVAPPTNGVKPQKCQGQRGLQCSVQSEKGALDTPHGVSSVLNMEMTHSCVLLCVWAATAIWSHR